MDVSELLRQVMRKNGLKTYKELADLVGKSDSLVGAWFSESHPKQVSEPDILKLCELAGANPLEVSGGKFDKRQNTLPTTDKIREILDENKLLKREVEALRERLKVAGLEP